MVNRSGLMSMTGFAAHAGEAADWEWSWELRSVNAKGLDLRLRVPEGFEALEPLLRTKAQAVLSRGAVTAMLRVKRRGGAGRLSVDPTALEAALDALDAAQSAAKARGVALLAPSAAEVLSLRGVMETAGAEAPDATALAAIAASLDPALADLREMRAAEGARLKAVLDEQVDRIADLRARAALEAEARRGEVAATLRENLKRVLEAGEVDEARVAQELALLAVKADVTEELDRLDAHVGAARALLSDGKPAGRKLDFLMQEFLREANTLCSKSSSAALTALGLELKVVIDQMREQVQNVE